jgi:hydroxylamine reductase (hybrid-cluster protein)
MYGLKGLCAYAHHAEALGHRDPKVYADVQEQLFFLCSPGAGNVGEVLEHCFSSGATNFRVMEMLSNAHTGTFGHPVPTSVTLNPVPGKAILVTGHDMHDLHLLLEQTAGKGINVYTHGEVGGSRGDVGGGEWELSWHVTTGIAERAATNVLKQHCLATLLGWHPHFY